MKKGTDNTAAVTLEKEKSRESIPESRLITRAETPKNTRTAEDWEAQRHIFSTMSLGNMSTPRHRLAADEIRQQFSSRGYLEVFVEHPHILMHGLATQIEFVRD